MEKREKIIVAVAVLAALYGAVDFLFLAKKKPVPIPNNNQARLSTVTAQFIAQTQGKDSKLQHLIQQVNTPWPQEVFFTGSTKTLLNQPEENNDKKEITSQFNPSMFIYSGFLQMGAKKMAIINGNDYKKGDNINGFTLAKIKPGQIEVVLEGMPFIIPIKLPINP